MLIQLANIKSVILSIGKEVKVCFLFGSHQPHVAFEPLKCCLSNLEVR